MKYVFLSAFLVFSTSLCAQDTSTVVSIQQAQIEKIRQQLIPVGTVLTSLLPWADFQKQAGGKWVRCNGVDSVQNTTFGRLTGRTVAPNCEGRFLRASGGMAANPLGSLQEESLKSHNHEGTVNINHDHGSLGYTLFDIDVTWTPGHHSNHAVIKRDSPNQLFRTAYYDNRNLSIRNTGGDETRPDNITVAVYIKVD